MSGDEIAPGRRIGPYTVDRFLAKGGCGAVYAAYEEGSGRAVALKVLHPHLVQQRRVVDRFFREVDLCTLLQHPNIVKVYAKGTLQDERPFYVMEYLEGKTLLHYIQENLRLATSDALTILDPVCSALSAAHAAGIVHRDVKPSNVFLCGGVPSEVKLLDFGIAKLLDVSALGGSSMTTVGHVLGTPSIMAPEQLLSAPIDHRTDIYALGVLLFAMLTGSVPFHSADRQDMARQHLETPAPRPSHRAPVNAEIDAVVLRCLEKQPERRFQSVDAFLSALQKAAAGVTPRIATAPDHEVMAVGLNVDLALDASCLDDALAADVGQILDLCEDRLRSDGFILATSNESGILAVKPLPERPEQSELLRQNAAELASSLLHELRARPDADARVRLAVRMHVDRVILRGDAEPDVVGGALIHTGDWSPVEG